MVFLMMICERLKLAGEIMFENVILHIDILSSLVCSVGEYEIDVAILWDVYIVICSDSI
jgi:hypothetical protein